MATLKDIARLANTSLGTVDRALNNKPGINKDTRQKILRIAKSLNYTPNRMGKALVLKKQNIKLGFILEPLDNPYFEDIKRGVEQQKLELEDYGITTYIFIMNTLEENEQLELLERLRALGVSGIALNAINSPAVQERIDHLVDQGIKVVTCNTDNSSSKRSCFVGFENELSGRVAAELFAKFSGEKGKYLVEIGFKYILAHMDRLKGFSDKIKADYPDMTIVRILESRENDSIVLENTLRALEEHPDLTGIYCTCFGINGIVNALTIKNLQGKVKIICHDHMPRTDDYIRGGIVDATICQDGAKHGYMAMKILSELVINNRESKKQIYLTTLDIRLQENLGDKAQDWEI
ncbi:MAG: LacI family DNA-binding transcriptional regulator [Spirochaetaceae bacterium]|jgi:LacI family transcriptional regulator|nr:LacI family DNA-binding transcriptional regulator [Spirochaetaceae bacterium]